MKAALAMLHGAVSTILSWILGLGYYTATYKIGEFEVFRIDGWSKLFAREGQEGKENNE